MSRAKILLDPVDFDALHMSVLANGGIGGGNPFRYLNELTNTTLPHCAVGHAGWLEGMDGGETGECLRTPLGTRLAEHGLTWQEQDIVLSEAGLHFHGKPDVIDFDRYIRLLNIDIDPASRAHD